MEFSVLLHFLASLQLLSRLVSPAAPLEVTVIVDPQHPVYFPGERLTLRCLAPGGEAVTSYQFYNQRGEWVFTEADGPRGGPWLVLMTDMRTAGAYSCEYWAERNGKSSYSARSQSVQVPVLDFPPAPSLSASSDPLGKSSITLVCSAPQKYVAERYQFLRQGNIITSQTAARLQLRTSDLHATATYTCTYAAKISGRTIQSLQSIPLSIHHTGPFVRQEFFRPTLRLLPTGPVFTIGTSVTLTCSAPRLEKKIWFCFHKAGKQLGCTGQTLEDSQSYQIGRLSLADSGSYTCMYRVAEPGQESSSPDSQPITITVTGGPVLPPAPQIILSPPRRIYLQGERVRLTCSAPDSEQVRGYRFYEQRGEQVSELDEGAYLEHKAQTEQAVAYSCAYWTVHSGQVILSQKSSSVSIPVTAPPLAPTLSLLPQLPVYLPGEKIILSCSAPHGEAGLEFSFHQHRGDQSPAELQAGSGGNRLELTVQKGNDDTYTCRSWRREAGQKIVSRDSHSITVPVSGERWSTPAHHLHGPRRPRRKEELDCERHPEFHREFQWKRLVSPEVPQLTVSPQHPVYIEGEAITLTCSAAKVATISRIRFFRDGQKIHSQDLRSTPYSHSASFLLSGLAMSDAGAYSCDYSVIKSGKELESERNPSISIAVTNPPPQPMLSVDAPSREASEGLPPLIICTATGNVSERRFHFYKGGSELLPGEAGSEMKYTAFSASPTHFSVLSIPQAWTTHTEEFTCGYEDNVSGRWIPSSRSWALNFTVHATRTGKASPKTRDVLLTTGGVLLVAGALVALICYCHRKERGSNPLRNIRRSEARECTRDLNPSYEDRGSEAQGAGMQHVEQGSEITYAHIEFLALGAHTTQSKTKAKPAEEQQVLYSEVMTRHTQKADE
ncbi:Fc receptor-like protein 5 [Carettochelys insculpta]|uniref:Fc receptor-like protein 5 n=1 Tax=Carettochelys insculpta TaxID=44489 RepID=UPI003EBD0EE9